MATPGRTAGKTAGPSAHEAGMADDSVAMPAAGLILSSTTDI